MRLRERQTHRGRHQRQCNLWELLHWCAPKLQPGSARGRLEGAGAEGETLQEGVVSP